MERTVEIGQFGKPHGIAGEINAALYYDGIDLGALRCIVVEIDGLRVPFFVESVRPKGRDGLLVKIDGYDSMDAVRMFVNHPIYALAEEVEVEPDDAADGEEGLYAADLIGWQAALADGTRLGEITDIDDNTANVLFIISRPAPQRPLYVPVAEEFIAGLDPESRTVALDLPDGIVDLND